MKILDVPQSGSLAGVTSSRNRFGQYRRTRATPVNPNTSFQADVRARTSGNAAAWRALTDLQRAGWESLGASMQRTDSLGQTYTLNGFMAFVSVNNNKVAAGDAVVSDAPERITPSTPTVLTLDVAADTFDVTLAPDPLPANTRAFIFASPQRSAGRQFEGDLRLIEATAAAADSPIDILTPYTARFGVPVVGNRIFVSVHAYRGGFLSGNIINSAIVAA